MKFLLDENLPLSLVQSLRDPNFDVEHVILQGLRGVSDQEIALYARENNRILITKDLEFGNPLIYNKEAHYGLIILRLPYYTKKERIVQILRYFLKEIDVNKLKGKIVVLQLKGYRIKDW